MQEMSGRRLSCFLDLYQNYDALKSAQNRKILTLRLTLDIYVFLFKHQLT